MSNPPLPDNRGGVASMTTAIALPVRVLVFPCGTEIGLEIHRALAQCAHVELVGASSIASNHGVMVFSRYVDRIPFINEPSFLEHLSRLVEEQGIDWIYPAHDDVLLELARLQPCLPCRIIAPEYEVCRLCRSKSATYAHFRNSLSVPEVYAFSEPDPAYPIFLKPDAGQGSQGVMKAGSREEWTAALAEDPTRIALEFLPGKEYTVDCFTDRQGVLRFIGPRERIRTSNGISVHTRPVPADESMRHFATCINTALALRGAWFFQLKRDAQDILKLLEIAPRVSGGMGLYRNLGVNLPLLGLYDRLDKEVEIEPLSHDLEMDRALFSRFRPHLSYSHVYMDLDDTLIQHGKVNLLAAAFLHQCRNNGVQVHLLTRHAGELSHTLARHGLKALFTSITHLNDRDNKAEFIQSKDALFIDDSFAERSAVHTALGIPVFAPDAVESLLDWRV